MIHFPNGINDFGHTELLARAYGVDFKNTTPEEQIVELRQLILKGIKNKVIAQLRREAVLISVNIEES